VHQLMPDGDGLRTTTAWSARNNGVSTEVKLSILILLPCFWSVSNILSNTSKFSSIMDCAASLPHVIQIDSCIRLNFKWYKES